MFHGVSPQTSKEFCYAKKHFCKLSTKNLKNYKKKKKKGKENGYLTFAMSLIQFGSVILQT